MKPLQIHHAGFTLIEAMITVAIIAILAAVAYPSYTQHIAKGKRSAAQGFMFTVANKQEQYLLDRRTYASGLSDLNLTVPNDVSSNYAVTLSNITATTYTVVATPNAAQANADSKCKTLTLDHTGLKGVTGTAVNCWQ